MLLKSAEYNRRNRRDWKGFGNVLLRDVRRLTMRMAVLLAPPSIALSRPLLFHHVLLLLLRSRSTAASTADGNRCGRWLKSLSVSFFFFFSLSLLCTYSRHRRRLGVGGVDIYRNRRLTNRTMSTRPPSICPSSEERKIDGRHSLLPGHNRHTPRYREREKAQTMGGRRRRCFINSRTHGICWEGEIVGEETSFGPSLSLFFSTGLSSATGLWQWERKMNRGTFWTRVCMSYSKRRRRRRRRRKCTSMYKYTRTHSAAGRAEDESHGSARQWETTEEGDFEWELAG